MPERDLEALVSLPREGVTHIPPLVTVPYALCCSSDKNSQEPFLLTFSSYSNLGNWLCWSIMPILQDFSKILIFEWTHFTFFLDHIWLSVWPVAIGGVHENPLGGLLNWYSCLAFWLWPEAKTEMSLNTIQIWPHRSLIQWRDHLSSRGLLCKGKRD